MLAKRLKELRFRNEITQAEFARVIGVAQQTVGGWERNYSSPNYDLLNKIANYFNVTTDYLLGREVETSPPLSTEQRKLLRDFESLNDDGQNTFLNVLTALRIAFPARLNNANTKSALQKNDGGNNFLALGGNNSVNQIGR